MAKQGSDKNGELPPWTQITTTTEHIDERDRSYVYRPRGHMVHGTIGPNILGAMKEKKTSPRIPGKNGAANRLVAGGESPMPKGFRLRARTAHHERTTDAAHGARGRKVEN